MFIFRIFFISITLLFCLVANLFFNSAEASVYTSNGKFGYKGVYHVGYKGYWLDFSKEVKFIIPPIYDKIELLEECFEETYLLVTKNNKKTIIKHNNVPVFSYNKFKNLEKVPGWAGLNYVKVTSHSWKYGAYLWDKYIVPAKYDNIEFHPATIIVTENNLKGLYNSDGNLVIPVKYNILFFEDDASSFVIAAKNNKYGVLSTIPCVKSPILDFQYDYIETGSHIIKRGNLYGKYSWDFENELLPVIYDKIEILDKYNDLYKIVKNKKVGLFYKDRIICNPKYDSIEQIEKISDFVVKLNGKYGLISQDFDNNSVNVILPVEYDKITFEGGFDDIYALEKNNKTYYFSKKQKKILP